MNDVREITACRGCGASRLVNFFDLGNQPLANSLLKRPDEKESFYPLSLSWCGTCHLVQLDHTVDPRVLFSSYVWVTGTSKTAVEYAERFYNEVFRRIGGSRDGYVLEIASNDGTFLKPFKQAGHAVLGIDAAENIVQKANAVGIETEPAFFSEAYAHFLVRRRGQARIVFARNVLPHVADTRDFVKGLRAAVADDGMVIVEVHDAGIIAQELHYDSIYHEHVCYFTFTTLERLLRSCGLYVADMMWSPISGGSMVVFARPMPVPESKTVTDCRSREKRTGVNLLPNWKNFSERAYAHCNRLREYIQSVVAAGGSIIGYGASARSSTLLNFCRIDRSLVPVIIDKNPLKQGWYTAGTHIPIESPEKVFASKNLSHILLLAWNFEQEIKEYLEQVFRFRGSFIIPLPGMPRVE